MKMACPCKKTTTLLSTPTRILPPRHAAPDLEQMKAFLGFV